VADLPAVRSYPAEHSNAPTFQPVSPNETSTNVALEISASYSWRSGQTGLRPEDPEFESRVRYLASAPVFHGLSRTECCKIARAAHEVWYSLGQSIFLQDDPVRHVFLVKSGMVKVTQVSQCGKETLLRVERGGGLIDDVTGASHLHSLTARAVQSCCLLVWNASVFEAFSQENLIIEHNASAIIRARLSTLQERFCDFATLRVPQRLARLVIQLSTHTTEGLLSPIILSREELAQMTGTSLFTVSRLLSSWAESEIVTVDRKSVVIEDILSLQQIADAA
jgi:CRP-like cAMP-binding protein